MNFMVIQIIKIAFEVIMMASAGAEIKLTLLKKSAK